MRRAPWRKLADLQARYCQPRARDWLIAMGVIKPATTTLRRVRLPTGAAVLRIDVEKEHRNMNEVEK